MRIVADHKIAHVEAAFGSLGDLILSPGQKIMPETVADADILLVRSVTEVDEKLLTGSKVKFVGTATIGVDHIDTEYLRSNGITLASAPGCNANAVAEYVLSGLFYLSKRLKFSLKEKSLGVVGVGNVGSKIVRMARALGMEVLQNDPPLARQTGDAAFVPLDALMDADIITLHVPLTRSGKDATVHLFGEERIAKLNPGCILINTSRGSVVETKALKDAIASGQLGGSIIDVWDNEPDIDTELLSSSTLATPHIAGYSLEGKINATQLIYEALCKFLGRAVDWQPENERSNGESRELVVTHEDGNPETTLSEIVTKCYPIAADDLRLRQIVSLPHRERGTYFEQLRSGYPLRREFSNTTITLQSDSDEMKDLLRQFGFTAVKSITA